MRAPNAPKFHVDKRLSDIRKKLRKLQYNNYSLLAAKDTHVDLSQKKSLEIGNGHSVALRPLYIEGKRIGMWLRWEDPNGMKVLDTRMHFNCGEPMLTGLEHTDDTGIILAIQVQPKDKDGNPYMKAKKAKAAKRGLARQ